MILHPVIFAVVIVLAVAATAVTVWTRAGATPTARRWMDPQRVPATWMVRGYVVLGLPLTVLALLASSVLLVGAPTPVHLTALGIFAVAGIGVGAVRWFGAPYALYPGWARPQVDAEIRAGAHRGFARRREELARQDPGSAGGLS